ncbi:hypothetical protein CROQUDRAFT_653938 [Cronartium quercuum f. sp. fusiforme G11]|uniref:Uncharacterized protein n=1 Tax=Cronartium quercuum f. sp. fusiforme G11 TaxID=708437 RepID=A0A9P6NP52_9BASI|nr:hypothetical protein CROQUDRAFT_653938 [Cronartium quercuum f. sp. fusiforme G11]
MRSLTGIWTLVTVISLASLISVSVSDVEKLVTYNQLQIDENLGSQAIELGSMLYQGHVHSKTLIQPKPNDHIDPCELEAEEDPDHHHDVEHQWSWDQLHLVSS